MGKTPQISKLPLTSQAHKSHSKYFLSLVFSSSMLFTQGLRTLQYKNQAHQKVFSSKTLVLPFQSPFVWKAISGQKHRAK